MKGKRVNCNQRLKTKGLRSDFIDLKFPVVRTVFGAEFRICKYGYPA
jgi:hypothetical protein